MEGVQNTLLNQEKTSLDNKTRPRSHSQLKIKLKWIALHWRLHITNPKNKYATRLKITKNKTFHGTKFCWLTHNDNHQTSSNNELMQHKLHAKTSCKSQSSMRCATSPATPRHTQHDQHPTRQNKPSRKHTKHNNIMFRAIVHNSGDYIHNILFIHSQSIFDANLVTNFHATSCVHPSLSSSGIYMSYFIVPKNIVSFSSKFKEEEKHYLFFQAISLMVKVTKPKIACS